MERLNVKGEASLSVFRHFHDPLRRDDRRKSQEAPGYVGGSLEKKCRIATTDVNYMQFINF